MMKKFLLDILNPNTESSIKRFVVFVTCIHFMLTSFLVSFFIFYLIIYTPKGTVNKDLISVLLAILKYDFYIICTGVGLVTAADMYNDSLEKERCRERGGYYDFDGDDRGEGRSWGRYENEKEEPVPPLDSAK